MGISTNKSRQPQWDKNGSNQQCFSHTIFRSNFVSKNEKEMMNIVNINEKDSQITALFFVFFLEKPEEDLYKFRSFLNILNQNIQFTTELSDCSISIPDIMVLRHKSKISTDVYHKTTDTHQYLNFESCHLILLTP